MSSIFTRAVHAGDDHDSHYGALSVPIYPASVFAFPDADEGAAIHNELKPGYYYGRLGNPTEDALNRAMAELESAEAALSFASGMAAVSATILSLVQTGEHIVAPASGYATTMNLLHYLEGNFGIDVSFVDASDAQNYANAIRPKTRMLWIETPSNPLLTVTDLEAVVTIARDRSLLTVADNTFATPFNQRPCELGVDLVLHSATKYLGGHSDLTAGAVVGRQDLIKTIRNAATKYFGGNIAPQVAWLVLRGLKTLALRMERHNNNAYALADMLARHPKVKTAFYPGLAAHPTHDVARKQMAPGFGGMISFDVGTVDAGKRFVNAVKLCTLATSLGGVETIVQHSASMTHATLTSEERQKAGVTDGMIRLSVGIEDIEDLEQDISHALERV
jgi:methionine-gamma-lyase